MKPLATAQMENIFKDTITHRKTIDDSKDGRMIERVEFSNRKVFIKYGWDADVQREMNIYKKVLNNSKIDPVPQLLVAKEINNYYFLATEWIDGIHPDFRNPIHIEKVFTSLGKWVAYRSQMLKDVDYIKRDVYSHFEVLDNLLRQHQKTLIPILGNPLIDLLNDCMHRGKNIIQNIEKTPLTLNPGDISLHNCIMNSDEKVIFIDFESCTVSPMITLIEHLGEDYQSIPYTKDGVNLALRSYLNSWNQYANKNIEWNDFVYCQLCARIYYNIGNFNYWIGLILEDKNNEETLEWVSHGHEQLQSLLNAHLK